MADETSIAIVRTRQLERVVIRGLPAPGPPGPPGDLPLTLEIELTLSRFYPNAFKEIVYDTVDLDLPLSIITWDSTAKLNQVFIKSFTYDVRGKIQSVTTTYVPTGAKIVKHILRNSSGRFSSIDRTFTT